jgi:hypothetical protein
MQSTDSLVKVDPLYSFCTAIINIEREEYNCGRLSKQGLDCGQMGTTFIAFCESIGVIISWSV